MYLFCCFFFCFKRVENWTGQKKSTTPNKKLKKTKKTTTTKTMGIPKQKDNDTCVFFLFLHYGNNSIGITMEFPVSDSLARCPVVNTCITSAADCCSAGDDWLLRMFASFTWEPSSFHKRVKGTQKTRNSLGRGWPNKNAFFVLRVEKPCFIFLCVQSKQPILPG